MELSLQRVTLTGGAKAVTFNTVCGKWLVKNFTTGDIYVSFDSNLVESKAVKIAAGHGQVIVINEYYDWNDALKSNTIYVKGTGEVEVQQLCYH
jgi:hypothetical protein